MNDSLLIFARQPVPGRVKTRLAAGIGDKAAAAIYAFLLEHTLDAARRSKFEVVVSLAESSETKWTGRLGAPVEVQSGGDLGERMAECARRRFDAGASTVVIIGSDNARLRSHHIEQAFAALEGDPVVLGPADDGGYWLVGQRAPGVDLFAGVPWSSPETLRVTRERLLAHGVRWHELETLPDIDTAEDLQRAIVDERVPEELRRKLQKALR